MMTLPLRAQAVDEYFYGELDQWQNIKTNKITAKSGKVQSLKATQTEEALYLNVKMATPQAAGTFYLETGSSETGYEGRGLWGGTPAIDYKVEDGSLYKYEGFGTDENWNLVGTIETTLLEEDVVVRVDFKLLGFTAPQPLEVAYFLDPIDYLPAGGAPLLRVSRRIFADETTVFEQSFWDSRTTAAYNTEIEMALEAVCDHQKLFVIVRGDNLNTRNTYFIETEAKGGYSHPFWPESSVNYKVDAGILYEYNESDAKNDWVKVGPVYTYITGEAVIMSVDLALLKSESSSTLKLGYTNDTENFMPLDGGSLLTIDQFVEQPIRANTFYPIEYHGTLNNPFKGWAPNSQGGPYQQPHRLVRTQLLWSDIEPERGVFDWETFETRNNFEYWDSMGVSYIIRFRMDVPSKRNADHMEIPQWLYEMIDGDGTHYDNDDIGTGFSPNYENPILIAEHERLIKAIGERYNDDPRVAFVQLGSVGHWGEWHTWPEGSGKFPVEEVANQYMQHYIDHLDKKLLGIRRPLAHARENNFGFFNDRIGYAPTTEQWLFWLNNGMDYEDWYNGRVYPDAAVPDFWKTAYSAGEFGSGNALLWLKDDTVVETLRQVRLSHTSWIGPCSPAGLHDIPEITNVETLLKTIGYRYVIETVTHSPIIGQGQTFNVEMVWNNKGVAPFYFAWPVELGLVDTKGELVVNVQADVDIRQWLPGRNTLQVGFNIPSDLPAGEYTLVTSINDPSTGQPGVDLAIEGRREDGRYALSTVVVEK